ncbi:MAG TPA: alpha-galactosidase, partial [Phycisphaerales bacterium]|nr:alpha-galactosidase [Phycisphaerales bacterium]
MQLDQWNVPIQISGDLKSFEIQSKLECVEPGLCLYTVMLKSTEPDTPPQIALKWDWPGIQSLAIWHPTQGPRHNLSPIWGGPPLESRSASSAPVMSLYHLDGTNRLTFACDDALHPVGIKTGVIEENGCMGCELIPFAGQRQAASEFKFTLRLDVRQNPLADVLGDTCQWWENMEGYEPLDVPDVATLPVYSTWYSYHQIVDSPTIETECKLAYDMGCRSVIMDDGWQTNDDQRGYAYTGDWQPQRLTDIKEHIQRVHDMGMQYILWYSVPFVGYHSENYDRFKGMYLYDQDRSKASVLDPRYPQVREFLIQTYLDAQRKWELDGFKLDFVDSFRVPESEHPDAKPGRDMDDVYEAVDVLLKDVVYSLKAANPEILIEFRQSYIGPLMRSYGNLFRAGDCPMDVVTNRVQTLNLRMLSGNTAVHSDMFMWHPKESAEVAALQLLNVFFSVPQVSVKLEQITDAQRAMLKHYLALWIRLRKTLLQGKLRVSQPHQNYTYASS